MRAIRRFFPRFAPLEYRNSVEVNAFLRTAYGLGQTKTDSFAEAAKGVAPILAIYLAVWLAGMRFTLTVPIKFGDAVVAGISFSQTPRFTPSHIRICEAFAKQAALSLENAQLSQTLSLQLQDLERSQRLLTENEERVRREISELLHTRVQTKLLIAWHRLSQYEQTQNSQAKQQLIEQVRDELEQIREEDVRDASQMLHPSVIRIGLIPAVRSLAARLQKVLRVQVISNDQALAADQDIPEALRLVAYRIIEEALSNTLKHAQAKEATVRILLNTQTLEVQIEDSGQGFNRATFKTGLGLSSLEARVLSVGGTWNFERINNTTRLTARLPL
jgi:signal transduction histidine kinase